MFFSSSERFPFNRSRGYFVDGWLNLVLTMLSHVDNGCSSVGSRHLKTSPRNMGQGWLRSEHRQSLQYKLLATPNTLHVNSLSGVIASGGAGFVVPKIPVKELSEGVMCGREGHGWKVCVGHGKGSRHAPDGPEACHPLLSPPRRDD
jgi:hypothetical protein